MKHKASIKALQIFALSFILIAVSISASAQEASLRRAERLMNDLNYQKAIEIYSDVLDRVDIPAAKGKLADCYRLTAKYRQAEYWYAQVVRDKDADPDYLLHYAMALQINGKCELAKEWFKNYLKLRPNDDRAVALADNCEAADVAMLTSNSANLYKVTNLPFNTDLDDFGPTIFQDGIVYASEQNDGGAVRRIHTWTGQPFLELFYSKYSEGENGAMQYSLATEFANELTTKYHDGPVALSPEGQTMYFTRNNVSGKDDGGVIRLKIYAATLSGQKWANIRELPFNSDEYSVAHPAVSPNGNLLFFSSDMPGGFGGMDLYMSEMENGRWGPPFNLGPQVNTEGHEVFPTTNAAGKLYFSSDGHNGLGGLDVYYTQVLGAGVGTVVNVGFPINSTTDDFHLIYKDNGFGYFTSNREGGQGGDDIYSFTKEAVEVDMYVFDKNTGLPISGAVVIDDCNGLPMKTNAMGHVIGDLALEKCCNYVATMEGYETSTTSGCSKGFSSGAKLLLQFGLDRKLDFAIAGSAKDGQSGQSMANAEITLVSDCGGAAKTIKTDATGAFNIPLDKDCCYTATISKSGFNSVSENICTRGMDRSRNFSFDFALEPTRVVISVPDNPGPTVGSTGTISSGGTTSSGTVIGGATSGSTVIVNSGLSGPINSTYHIYYGFNKFDLTKKNDAVLRDLYTQMKNNPGMTLVVNGYTDSRGPEAYNIHLSQKRAETVLDYLASKGIDRTRLSAIGMGEQGILNECIDGVNCPPTKHQRNRRSELSLRVTIDGQAYEARSLERPEFQQ